MATDPCNQCSDSSSKDNSFTVYITTGDRPRAGTNANVYIILHGDGKRSREIELGLCFRDDFERGQTDNFSIKKVQFSKVDSVEIWRDDSGFGSEWLVDTIFVENDQTKEKIPFPVFRWIKADYHYTLIPYDTYLPQHDNRKEQRRLELEEKRQVYQYECKMPGLSPQVRTLPPDETFSFDYKYDMGLIILKFGITKELLNITSSIWSCIEDVKCIFDNSTFGTPSDLDRWSDDVKFGHQRLVGVNSMQIRLCTEIPENLGATAEMLEPFLEGQKLDSALNNKKIYLIDYKLLEDCPATDGFVLCAPLALFFERADGNLVPIAIQLFQQKRADHPVFLPSDPKYTWILAKMWFNTADASYHQAVSHLGFTHLILECVALSVNRQISQSHPIYKLLAPHFLYLMAINSLALDKLLAPGGYIDQAMITGVKGALELIRRARSVRRLNVDGTLPMNLRERGVDDMNRLPNYHSRNDAVLLYDAIKRYVTKYVDVYYDTEDDILRDEEIQAWRSEMVRHVEDGGLGIHGVPGQDGKFTKKEHLVVILTSVIYTGSVEHAMVNFKQYDEYAFPPNYPSKLSGTPPKTKAPVAEKDIIEILPTKDKAMSLMVLYAVLSTRGTQHLGHFEVNYIFDPKAVEVVEEFRKDLKEISNVIRARNEERDTPYVFLDPAEIPNAISI